MQAGIIGTGSSVPENVVTNQDIENWGIDTTAAWIAENTGILERRFALPDETTSDYATWAAHRALTSSGLSVTEIDLIIVATTTPDHLCPSTAVTVQKLLGATCPAFDLQAGCSGFMYNLVTAKAYIESGMYQNILVVGVDLLSRITNLHDRGTAILLGDGAGAMIVGPVSGEAGISSFVMGADGSQLEKLYIPAGGSKIPLTPEGLETQQHKLVMAGPEVFRFAIVKLPEVVNQLVDQADINLDEIDLIFPHQANRRIIKKAAQRLGLPIKKFYMNLDRYGNTSSASIPLAVDEAARAGLLHAGMKIVLVGFGAGLTWAGCLATWAYDI